MNQINNLNGQQNGQTMGGIGQTYQMSHTPSPASSPAKLPPTQDKIDTLLSLMQQNNELLKKIYDVMRKQARRQIYGAIWHALIIIIPVALSIYAGYYLLEYFNAKLESINSVIEKVQDVGDMGSSLKEDLQFWK